MLPSLPNSGTSGMSSRRPSNSPTVWYSLRKFVPAMKNYMYEKKMYFCKRKFQIIEWTESFRIKVDCQKDLLF